MVLQKKSQRGVNGRYDVLEQFSSMERAKSTIRILLLIQQKEVWTIFEIQIFRPALHSQKRTEYARIDKRDITVDALEHLR